MQVKTVVMKNMQLNKKALKKWFLRLLIVFGLCFFIWYIQCIPNKLFNDSTSTVLLDKNGVLLGARIAKDGQWRFAGTEKIPEKFKTCLLQFEDRTFYAHAGISIKAIGRAIIQNFKNSKVVSGGSTITMQLARIMRKNPPRTYTEKILEMFMATRMEIRYSKEEILRYYCSHAPFGTNVVGLEAAAWRYYGRSQVSLSWAECATLAVLPNAPGLIYPGKNHDKLLNKRNRLLKRLYDIKKIEKTTYDLSLLEPLPEKPLRLAQLAPHVLENMIKAGHAGKTISTTIDHNIQLKANQKLQTHLDLLQENRINNGAVIISSVTTGEILAYVGNTSITDVENSCYVDCAQAPRSSGSILKPLLYEKCLEHGMITPTMLLPDIPVHYGTFSPKNFSLQYTGAVHANSALSQSLNIPMVYLLKKYGLAKFYNDLKNYGFTSLQKAAKHYGLTLILGGAEVTLSDLNKVYTQMAQKLAYNKLRPVSILPNATIEENQSIGKKYNRAAIYSAFEAMVEVNRPNNEVNWKVFSSSQKIAWKTGTSFGFRDAWAIGITPDYVVSVWIGNAEGNGRPGLTGTKAAAPLLFNLFSLLPKSGKWFVAPREEQCRLSICKNSGYRSSEFCNETTTVWVPKSCLNTTACPYHKMVHLTKNGQYRVDSDCESIYNMKNSRWFVLPPLIERYYKKNHPNYKALPAYRPDCLAKISDKAMFLLYPKPNSEIYIPPSIDGGVGSVIFEASHKSNSTKIYWHLDDEYLGETIEIHQISVNSSKGKHKLKVIDESGIAIAVDFEVIGKGNSQN